MASSFPNGIFNCRETFLFLEKVDGQISSAIVSFSLLMFIKGRKAAEHSVNRPRGIRIAKLAFN
jgi:hypothetical protein